VKRKFKVLGLLIAVALISAGGALLTKTYYHPHEGTIANVSLAEYYDGQPYANSTTVSWGSSLIAGQTYNKTYRVHNTGTVTFQVTMTVKNLPQNWTLTWAGNNTILDAGEDVTGMLQLTIPTNATAFPSFQTYTTATQT